ncbi:hypothetical protein SEA_WEASELS2_150 [Rhodococcus phage Weasels2]|uniref:Uncharacterized protein n=1 Tax=Rhodococcus phage Weasels2 TaxID=1897437 RepID=A0A1I9SAC4_9CAUD|nr:hypothetical protein FDH04_gp264 [Rhodococcus phage Weasels2]AOZ63730.1 hypothetical protein SEA_WEASELS2_150 [Rhodococcus phage Weasels2]
MISTVKYWSVEDEEPVVKDIYKVSPINEYEYYIEYTDLGKHWVSLLLKMHQHYINSEIDQFVATSQAVEYGKKAVIKILLENYWPIERIVEEYREPGLYDYQFKNWYDLACPLPDDDQDWLGLHRRQDRFIKIGQ